jgi:hypothetical protein
MRANKGEIFNTMEIELLKPNGATNHNYSLPFSIVGVIET